MLDKDQETKIQFLLTQMPYMIGSVDSILSKVSDKSDTQAKFASIAATLVGLEHFGVITINNK